METQTIDAFNPLAVVVNAVPSNITEAFRTNNSILAVVVVAIGIGLCLNQLGEKAASGTSRSTGPTTMNRCCGRTSISASSTSCGCAPTPVPRPPRSSRSEVRGRASPWKNRRHVELAAPAVFPGARSADSGTAGADLHHPGTPAKPCTAEVYRPSLKFRRRPIWFFARPKGFVIRCPLANVLFAYSSVAQR